jgi:diguanylate cyclase (GGDEF)-like protein
MPQPNDAPRPQRSAEESFLDLLSDTLASLDEPARGQFLQPFFRTVAQLDLSEAQSVECWEQILSRRQQLSQSLGQPVTLRTAMVEVLASTSLLRVPILMEYETLKKLQVSAATDPLTGLHNRRLFEEYFKKELNRAQRYEHVLALVIMDLHQFKAVNDRYGHPQGDQVLQAVARPPGNTLRASDHAVRSGGDEFAELLPHSDSEQALALSRRVRTHFENELRPMKLEVAVTLDCGVAVYPQDAVTIDELLRIADQRLYQWKSSVRTPPRVIPLEPPPPREPAPPPPSPRPAAVAAGASLSAQPATVPPRGQEERRKWERVSLSGTRAYAVLGEGRDKTARVIDLSYGGVSLQVERPEDLPGQFSAVLHVPILPPVRVSLRRTYVLRSEDDGSRVGCSFVS